MHRVEPLFTPGSIHPCTALPKRQVQRKVPMMPTNFGWMRILCRLREITFRAAGYDTFWKGKWHASEEDIVIPGTKDALPSYNSLGVPDKKNERIYKKGNRLDAFGFSDWIGPEPHGSDPRNSGSSAGTGTSGRDEVYAAETVELIKQLDKRSHCKRCSANCTMVIQCSFVNPHDIALYGMFSALLPSFNFETDPTLPYIPTRPYDSRIACFQTNCARKLSFHLPKSTTADQ